MAGKRRIQGVTIAVLASVLATGGAARTTPVPGPMPVAQPVLHGVRVAQAVQLPPIKPSAKRRLTFYSDKAIEALFELAKEDLAAGQTGASLSSETTNMLRMAIVRLIQAGEKSGLTVDQVALFFGQQVKERFSGPIPVILQNADGKLDAAPLFRSIEGSQSNMHFMAVNTDYMTMLQAEGAKMAGNNTAATGSAQPATPAAPQADATPVAPVALDPASQSILDRVEMVNGERTIVVIVGDTLASYASVFFGDTLAYRKIYLANEGVLTNPNFLEVGQRVVIPDR